jgi:hypothetical protein
MNEIREMTVIIKDLTEAGFTPEEITVFLDNPYQAYVTEMGKIGILVMLQRGMKERTLVKKIGSDAYWKLLEGGLIDKPEGSTLISLTAKGVTRILEYANTRERQVWQKRLERW